MNTDRVFRGLISFALVCVLFVVCMEYMPLFIWSVIDLLRDTLPLWAFIGLIVIAILIVWVVIRLSWFVLVLLYRLVVPRSLRRR